MSKQITIRDSQSISRDMLTTDENGNAVQIAMVSGDIRPGRGFSVTVHLTKPEQVAEAAEAFAKWVDDFIEEVKRLQLPAAYRSAAVKAPDHDCIRT